MYSHNEIVMGNKFGKLTFHVYSDRDKVFHTSRKKAKFGWFQCDCGRLVEKSVSHVRSGHTKTCGVCWKPSVTIKPGDKFQNLTFVEFTNRYYFSPSSKKRSKFGLFKCDCGKEKEIIIKNVISGRVKSCGCARFHDYSHRIGNKYGNLMFLGKDGVALNKQGTNITIGNFRCDCGASISVPVHSIFSGLVQSCGCLVGRNLDLPQGEAALRKCYRGYQSGAKNRGFSFELNIDEFKCITSLPCVYCGEPPSQEQRIKPETSGSYFYNGIDRVDSKIGYVKDNCVPSCKICNHMKRTFTHAVFIEHIAKVYNHLLQQVSP